MLPNYFKNRYDEQFISYIDFRKVLVIFYVNSQVLGNTSSLYGNAKH